MCAKVQVENTAYIGTIVTRKCQYSTFYWLIYMGCRLYQLIGLCLCFREVNGTDMQNACIPCLNMHVSYIEYEFECTLIPDALPVHLLTHTCTSTRILHLHRSQITPAECTPITSFSNLHELNHKCQNKFILVRYCRVWL